MNEDNISPDDIREYLDSQSDFSLEMKSFKYLIDLGYEAEHGGTYYDPVTGTPRQFDIRCTARKNNDNKAIKIAVECKALSKSFPLVIQRIPRTEKESFHEVLYAYDRLKASYETSMFFEDSNSLRTKCGSELYPENQYVGKAFNRIGKKNGKFIANNSAIYERWAQAISSSHGLVAESVTEREKLGFAESFTAIFPVLVVPDESLWCVDYDNKGEIASGPKIVNKIDFYIGNKFRSKEQMYAPYTASHLNIFTSTGYEYFTRRIASNEKYWPTVFPLKKLLSETQ